MTKTKARSCTGKIAYLTKEEAVTVSMYRRRRFGALPEHAWAYKCKFCPSWHVGHRR